MLHAEIERQIGELSKQSGYGAISWEKVLPLLNRCSQIIKGFEERIAPEERRIVCTAPPPDGRFIEVENARGESVNVGKWRERSDGKWELVISGPEARNGTTPEECIRAIINHWTDFGPAGFDELIEVAARRFTPQNSEPSK